jgi:IclR family KDG regulon transcriptional repressor
MRTGTVYTSYSATQFREEKYMAKALENALRVLEAVAEDPETPRPLGIIAARAGLNPATSAHILKTLAENGYVEQAGRKAGYTLGPAAHRLASRGPYRKDLVRRAEPAMARLTATTGETAVLAVLRGSRRVTLREVDGGAAVQVRTAVLREDDPWVSATGRVLVAGLADEALKDFLRAAGRPGARWPEACTAAGLAAALEEIRRQGFALVDRGEVTGLAFPVSERGRTVAALGVFLPTFRFASPNREKVLEALREAAAAAGIAVDAAAAGATRRRGDDRS